MQYRLVLYIDARHALYHCAKIYAGLDALANRGLIGLRVRIRQEFPDLVLLHATALDTNSQRLLAFELSDHSTFLCSIGLARCDVYFKRSLYRPHTGELAPEQRRKILPFGLNYGCASDASRPWVLWRWGRAVAQMLRRSPREGARRLRPWLNDLRDYVSLRDFRYFERRPETPVEAAVFFQTRVWEPQQTSEDLEQINEERVALIRQLRKALGTRFRGGIMPSPFARRCYPDVVVTEGYRQEDYVRIMQRYLIGINTRGLHQSLAFKLPEHLAASICIVSEPLRNELPQPLVAGQHYLEFRSHEECIAHCERLLGNPAEALEMRRHNFAYYRQWVAPPEHLLNCLERAFA